MFLVRLALELMKKQRPNFDQIAEFCRSPQAFLKYLDAAGVDRAVLINYVAPEVIGFTSGVNQFVADYVKEDPKRLLSCGSLHPRHTSNVLADVALHDEAAFRNLAELAKSAMAMKESARAALLEKE